MLPLSALRTLYSSLVLPHLTYGIKLWGSSCAGVELIQKRAIRVITNSKYFAHTSPLFKQNELLKLTDLYKYHCLNFHYKIENNLVPLYFRNFTIHNWDIYDYFARGRNDLWPTGIKSSWIRHSLPELVIQTPNFILETIPTCEIFTFKNAIKKLYISAYETQCVRHECLPCGRGQLL